MTFSLTALEEAAHQVHAVLPPTPQYLWPLLSARVGAEVWVKHENHTAVGAFKVRGGIVYMAGLKARNPKLRAVVAATRGNHGQSLAFAARRLGLSTIIVVPHGNSVEKNEAMRALGADLIVHGNDFQAALEVARTLAADRGLELVPSFAPDLVRGVASYALELFGGTEDLDRIYVPIGMGSGICGAIAARDALGKRTEIVGVVAKGAAAYALSFAAGKPTSTDSADTVADGMACRVPDADALATIMRGAARIVTVDDAEIRAAMRHYFTDTHNVAEGAGAAALAAAQKERTQNKGRRIALVLSGGNVDRKTFASILCENDNGEGAKSAAT